ncbi:MAG: nucleotidyltransferase domain-containing protein [Pseudomonadota bacterium]
MNITSEDIKKIREWAASHTEVLQIYLHGSRARGDHKPDSDIDLAIVMRPDDGQDNV